MTTSGTARALLVMGRLAASGAAAFALALIAEPGYELFRYAFLSGSLTWAGVIPRCSPYASVSPGGWRGPP